MHYSLESVLKACLVNKFMLGVLSATLFCSGCDTKKAAPAAVPAPTPSSTTSPTVAPSNTTSSTATPAAVPALATGSEAGKATPQSSPTQNNSAKAGSTAPSPTVAQAPVPPPTPTVAAKVQPTKEQLAKWKFSEFKNIELLKLYDNDKTGLVSDLVVLPDGKQFVLGGTKVTLWSIDSDEPVHTFLDLSSKEDQTIRSLSVSSDGKLLVTADSEGNVTVFDIADRKQLMAKKLEPSRLSDAAISPDAKELATLGYNSTVSTWNLSDLSPKKKFKLEDSGIKEIEYVSNGTLAVAGEKSSAWDTAAGKEKQQLSPGRYHTTLGRSPNGETFAYGTESGLVLLSAADLKEQGKLPGELAQDELVRFSPKGKQIASVSGAMVQIWDLDTQSVVQIIDDSERMLSDAAWLPNTSLLLVTSVDGRVSVLGNAADGEALGLKPLHKPIAAATGGVPASSEQLMQTMDLRTLPLVPGSTVNLVNESNLSYTTGATKDEAEMFCRYYLQSHGWSEIVGESAMPGAIAFEKDGCGLVVFVSDMGPSERSVNINFEGNFDLRKSPRPKGVKLESVYENSNIVMFTSAEKLIKLETELLKAMHADGWTAYARLNSSSNEQPDARDLEFLRNGIELRVSISRAPVDPSKYTLQFGSSTSQHALPIPDDSGFVEFDGSVSPHLVANTKMDLKAATEFYDKQMQENGWLIRDRIRGEKDGRAWRGYTRGVEAISIGFVTLPDGKTQILVGDKLGNSSWQIPKKESESADKPAPAGIEAADVPIPQGAQELKYDVDEESIRFDVATNSLASITDDFAKSMKALGWEKDTSGVTSDEYVLATFKHGKEEIEWRAHLREGKANVSIQGDELLWNKVLPGKPEIISYEAWQRRNKRLAGLDALGDYIKEMEAIEASAKN